MNIQDFARGFATALVEATPDDELPAIDHWHGLVNIDINFFGSVYGAPEGSICCVGFPVGDYNKELFKFNVAKE